MTFTFPCPLGELTSLVSEKKQTNHTLRQGELGFLIVHGEVISSTLLPKSYLRLWSRITILPLGHTPLHYFLFVTILRILLFFPKESRVTASLQLSAFLWHKKKDEFYSKESSIFKLKLSNDFIWPYNTDIICRELIS